ncbi:hypothetical protein RI129_000882 [Pyrocoelia pectoralis]|uniref:DUF659 domain-containing protein n=1 Tax=Pyrocoelia pectoralis TaxID=417401 RepID=A0AAN7ZWI1_9COLE
MQGLVERLKKHVSKCSTSTNPQEGEADKMLVHESHAATKRKAESEGSEAMQCKIQNKDGNVSKFIVRTSLTQKKEIDLQIARYMYATNSAFRCVENHQFQKLIGLLRPGYTPPSERDLSGPLLDRIHMEEMVKCQKTLERETICLTLDGWSNVHNQPIICACAIKMMEKCI